jgi:hypothetical protein
MFEDYKKDLLKFFLIKKENHHLRDNLEPLGRERLRKECIEVFLRKNSQKDKDLIRSVFDPKNESEDEVRSIEKFDLDKFRPLISFLTEKVKTIRDDKLVKLFAWLIDFPANEEWRELSEESKKNIFENAANGAKGTTIPPPTPEPPKPTEPEYIRRFSQHHIIISCIILLFIGSSSFVAWENSTSSVRMPNADEKCMYWNEDHYEPVKCNAQIANATIIPLDLKKLQRQRKINLSDTLTSYSLGKVWYKGFVKDHEFFTAAGTYPTDTTRVLRKLTPIILAKYISNNRYLQTRLIWLSYAIFFVALCGFGASRLKKEVQPPEAKPKVVEQEIRDFIQPQAANC